MSAIDRLMAIIDRRIQALRDRIKANSLTQMVPYWMAQLEALEAVKEEYMSDET